MSNSDMVFASKGYPSSAWLAGRVKQEGYYGMDSDIAEKHIASLTAHIAYVQEAGVKLGVSHRQLEMHDITKWNPEEFVGYALHFHGGGAPDKFAASWLHHMNHNPHHWQYWMFPDGYTPEKSEVENGILPMPHRYILEMIADWQGASMAYTDSWEMGGWLQNNMKRISLHSKTAALVRNQLDHLGYADIVYTMPFKHEIDRIALARGEAPGRLG